MVLHKMRVRRAHGMRQDSSSGTSARQADLAMNDYLFDFFRQHLVVVQALIATLGALGGFTIMTILDAALG
jgi:hypothetical protein